MLFALCFIQLIIRSVGWATGLACSLLLHSSGHGKLFCCCFLFVFNDFYQANYLKVCWTSLQQIFRVARTVAVDDQSEFSFLISQGTLPWQPIFVGCIHTT